MTPRRQTCRRCVPADRPCPPKPCSVPFTDTSCDYHHTSGGAEPDRVVTTPTDTGTAEKSWSAVRVGLGREPTAIARFSSELLDSQSGCRTLRNEQQLGLS